MAGKLTVTKVASLKAPGRYGDGNGLWLQVRANAGGKITKSWIFRYERSGKQSWMGLGPADVVSLAKAREFAQRARLALIEGRDPVAERKAQRATKALAAVSTITFEQAARAYNEQHAPKWKNPKAASQFLNTLRDYVFPIMGKVAVANIDTALVIRVLEPIWHVVPETARRVRGRIEAVLAWSTVRGYRRGDNPAQWRNHLDKVLPARGDVGKVEHHAAVPWAELPAFVEALRKREGVAARALEFTLLTAARTGEVIGARWDEVDLAARTWTIPAERMKAAKPHRVPLSDRAIEILEALPREKDNPYLFVGPRAGTGLSNMAMASVMRRMGRVETVHGTARSGFRDWAAEKTNYPNHVVEMALAHTVGDKVEAAYRRGDLFAKRQRLMVDWTKYLNSPATPAADNVVPLRVSRSS